MLALTANGATPAMGDAAYEADADVNRDGIVDFFDLQLVLADVGKTASGISQNLDDGGPGNPVGYAGYLYIDDFGGTSGDFGLEGHWYARHRYYDPVAGRWITRDPAGYVDGMSLYLYVGGNPFSLVDPLGLAPPGFRDYALGFVKNLGNWGDEAHPSSKPAAGQKETERAGFEESASDPQSVADQWGHHYLAGGGSRGEQRAASEMSDIGRSLRIGAEITIGVISEPVDWLMLLRDVVDDPSLLADATTYAAALPFISRGIVRAADGAIDIGRALSKAEVVETLTEGQRRMNNVRELGLKGERAIGELLGLDKNTTRFRSATGTANYRIPDFVEMTGDRVSAMHEVKNMGRIQYTRQWKDMVQIAKREGVTLQVWHPAGADVSDLLEAQKQGDLQLRSCPMR